jgi:protein phosphatase
MRVRFSARTHVGMRREVNQDAFGSAQPDAATLLVVCDGMGGHAAGEVASTLGVEAITATFRPDLPPSASLREAFEVANERIYAEGAGSMGTTGVAALFVQNLLYVANVGDSRAYLVREETIRQISRDHSFVSDQVDAGLMTLEQARASTIRNIITRALGHTASIEVDLFQEQLRPGDTVVLSSDGMHGLLSDAEIADVVGVLTLEEAAQRLVDTANERGGPDNITVVIARVDELDPTAQDQAETQSIEAAEVAASSAVNRSATHAPRQAPVERPLSRIGALLAAFAFVLLLGIGGLLLAMPAPDLASTPVSATPAAAPTPSATAASTPAPTATQ